MKHRVYGTVTLALTQEVADARSGEHAGQIFKSQLFSDPRYRDAIADIQVTKVEELRG